MLNAVRGRILCPDPDAPRFHLLEDGLLTLDGQGRIEAVGPAPAGCAVPETWPGAVVLPGFVDTHLHFPQTRVLGSASGPLLNWLQRSVFPEEARFAGVTYATQVAAEFCDALIAQGTTTASVYSSSHPVAAEVLLAEMDRRGLRGLVGLTLMDRGAPPEVLLPAGPALDAVERLVERWRSHPRLEVAVTPRFALSCSPELLRGAGEIARKHGLLVQTHLSENQAELVATAGAFPGAADYLGVYEDHGLVGNRSIFAHCIWLSEGEWARFAAAGAAVSHCPDSNFFLGSGVMRLRSATDRGVAVGLGTDVGAGRSFSLRRIVASAYDAALLAGAPVGAEELLWRATTGGARTLGLEVGTFEAGAPADLVAVDLPDHVDDGAVFDTLAFRGDAGPVRATVVAGRLV